VTVAGQDLTALAGRGPRAGRELRKARSRIGMVFQHFNLLSSRTVQDNIELPLEILGKSGKERSRKALELLDLVGLADKAKSYPAQLSGGQKQRVGIARALAGDPKVLLSDEATSALDPETTRSILQLLRDLNRQLGLTVLLITHEMDVVKNVCDSAALMENGRIVESGTVSELLATPGSELAAALFPVSGEASGDDRTVIDVTFHGEAATQPVISQLSRTYNIDISILGAAMDTVGGKPGRPDAHRTARPLRGQRRADRLPARAGPADRRVGPGARTGEGRCQVTWSEMQPLLEQACWDTLYMVGWSTVIAVVGGLPLGILLVLTDRGGLLQNTVLPTRSSGRS
jgi:ABC-type methionine transport system ATPase subunit